MPFKSKAQQGFFNANKGALESQGVDVDEFNQASKGMTNLPEHVAVNSTPRPIKPKYKPPSAAVFKPRGGKDFN